MTLKAREMPIVIGRPSGIDTTTRTTIMFMNLGIYEKISEVVAIGSPSPFLKTKVSRISLMIKIKKIIAADPSAPRVNCCSKLWSLVYKAVSSFTPRASTSSVFLDEVEPTQQTNAFPVPFVIIDPANKIGSH